jgi:phosphorylcholine metabolism protein LicD
MEECLSDMKKILDENNQHFFLVCGTLLGQQRENDFISYDTDIDLGIIYSKFNSSITGPIVNSGVFKLYRTFGKIKNSLEITFIHKTNTLIDIFIYYPINEEDTYYYCASYNGQSKLKPEGYYKWGNHIRGFNQVVFKNNIYNIPSNSDEFLTESYGDWRTPKEFNYDEGVNCNYYTNLIN